VESLLLKNTHFPAPAKAEHWFRWDHTVAGQKGGAPTGSLSERFWQRQLARTFTSTEGIVINLKEQKLLPCSSRVTEFKFWMRLAMVSVL
jgi:hypothetical protein